MRPLARLRRQLILSHLAAIAFTLVSMVAAVLLIASTWLASQEGTLDAPTQAARTVATAVGRLVARGDAADQVSVVLRALASGDLRLAVGPGPYAPPAAQRLDWSASLPRDLKYIVVLGPDGQPLASSAPEGAAFAPRERAAWMEVAHSALNGAGGQSREVQLDDGPAALGAYPVLDSSGRPIGAVVVATRDLSVSDRFPFGGFWRVLAFFSAASVAVLAAASVFALASAGLVGYFLSRRLVARLERLGHAAEALAAGDLSQRVEEGRLDEVGQLARRFNYMADRLAASVKALETAKGNVEAALHAKRELVANVSHELRTPLASIRGHTESLLMRDGAADGARQREYLEVIHRETEQLSGLIDDLFTLSTAEAAALPLQLEPVSVAESIEQVAASLRPVARRERQITIVVSVPPDLPSARADHQRVNQVLGNLARNALRYTPEGGLVSIRAERQGTWVRVEVEDTGEGIPPEQLPQIFERFYRGDSARDRSTGGAGLGLAIVRELVEAMGGEVHAESVVGQGSRFSFTLPLAAGGAVGVLPTPDERDASRRVG